MSALSSGVPIHQFAGGRSFNLLVDPYFFKQNVAHFLYRLQKMIRKKGI